MLASHHYILLMDADEALDKDLGIAILVEKQTGFSNRAYQVRRCNIYCGMPVRHGLWYPDKKIRLFDKRIAGCGGLNPHDRVIVHGNIDVAKLEGELLHYTCDSEAAYKKWREVSTAAAQSLFESGKRLQWAKLFLVRYGHLSTVILNLIFERAHRLDHCREYHEAIFKNTITAPEQLHCRQEQFTGTKTDFSSEKQCSSKYYRCCRTSTCSATRCLRLK